jgi:hypothetical protein
MVWWIPAALAIPLFFLWDIVHEGSHALAALLCGRKITSVKLWPHMEPDWGFVFGSVRFIGENNTFILVAPYFMDVLGVVAFLTSFALVDSDIVRSILATLSLAPIVNTTVAVQARYRGNDKSDLARIHWGWAIPFLYLVISYVLVFGFLVVEWMI